MKQRLLLLLSIIALSCNTYKHQLAKAKEVFNNNPKAFAANCAEAFPVKDSVGRPDTTNRKPADNKDYTKTIDSLQAIVNTGIKAMPQYVTDTNCLQAYKQLLNNYNQVKEKLTLLKQQYKPCQGDTTYISLPVYRNNTAAIEALQADNKTIADKLAATQEKLSKRNKQLVCAIVAIAVLGIIIFLLIKAGLKGAAARIL